MIAPVVHRTHAALASIRALLAAHPVPLLVLRTPEGLGDRLDVREIFAGAAQRVVREGDLLLHDEGSAWFAIALLSPSRSGGVEITLDVRAALERLGARMSLATGVRLETGWCLLETERELDAFEASIARALERGARERAHLEFLATVGHELRTPLTSIRGYLETVLDEELDAQTARRFLLVARSEALRLARLVDGMLAFSLHGRSEVCGESADLHAVTASVVESLAPIARDSRATLRTRLGDGLHAAIAPDACMHVLLNVVDNAIKYAGRGGTVHIAAERIESAILITVDDDGPGVAPRERDRVFESGARGSNAPAAQGHGLGLAIVRTIVERAAGSVALTDAPLGGARVVIRLPAAEARS
jgi:signal transduction histidine kinase